MRPGMLALLGDLRLRGWLGLLCSVVAVASMGTDLVRWATGPRYVDVPLAAGDAFNQATLALDRAGIPWRGEDGGGRLAVDARHETDGLRVLRTEGLLRRRARRRAAGPELAPDDRYERDLAREVDEMLAATVGRDRARVSIDATLDRSRRGERRLRYGTTGTPLERDRERWRLRGDLADGDGRYDTTVWARDRSVRAVRFAGPLVRRLSVALVVDPRLSRAETRSLRRAVSAAVGLDRPRGDVLVVSRVRLADASPEASGRPTRASVAALVPWTVLGLGIAIFLLEILLCLRAQAGVAPQAAARSRC